MSAGMMERTQTLPNIYSGYEDGKPDIVAQADERYMMNLSAWQLFFYEQLIDRKVYLGDQRYLNLYSGLGYDHQKWIFNNAMPVVNMLCGRQMQHRKATKLIPVHGSNSKTANQATKAIQSVYSNDNTYKTISSCFKEGAGITGLSLMHSYMDYRRDPICGDLKTECLSADMIMMDAFWREMDLSDCQFIRTRKYLHICLMTKHILTLNLLLCPSNTISDVKDSLHTMNIGICAKEWQHLLLILRHMKV